jgi:hypothetical protein
MASAKDQTAAILANKHYAIEPGITRIVRLTNTTVDESLETEPIKLLEVSETTVPLGIQPIWFGPIAQRGIPYPSVVIEVTPQEFEQIQTGDLKLPSGWLGHLG